MKPITVVFDLDGTLVNTAVDLSRALNHVLESEGYPPVDVGTIRPHIGLGARQVVAAGLHACGARVAEEDFLRMTTQLVSYYRAHIAEDSQIYPGIPMVLQTLRSQGMIMGVCTNKSETLARKLLAALDIDHFFAGVAGGDTYPVRKPDPGHVMGLIDQLGGTPQRSVLIGDSEVDIMTAQAAGLPIIAVSYGYSIEPVETYGPDIVLHDAQSIDAAVCALLDCGQPHTLH